MNINIFERLKIFFCGSNAVHFEIIRFYDNNTEHEIIASKTVEEKNKSAIIGFEVMSSKFPEQKINEEIQKHNKGQTVGFYFFTGEKKHINSILKLINGFPLGKIELYGIDPDYYYSFVPLNCKNHKLIEKYILDMKSEYSTKGFIKYWIKRVMINLNLSGKLYEGFILIVSNGGIKLDQRSRC